MTLTRRKPSGKPSWPIVLLAGCEGGGKSWAAAEATGSPRFGTSLWLEIGEQTADEYGAVPGAEFDILEHDGSFGEILAQLRAAVAEPLVEGKPNLLVVDSLTEMWDLLSDEQQTIANRKRNGKNGQDATITMDQWNAAKKRWGYVVAELRRFPGPVVVTARLEQVAVVGANGQPTGSSTWKIRAEKNLGFEVQVVMQAREPRQWVMTKIANTRLQLPDDGFLKWPKFTVEDLLSKMGLEDAQPSTYVKTDSSRVVGEADRAREMLLAVLEKTGVTPAEAAARFQTEGNGDLRTSQDSVAIGELTQYYESAGSTVLS